MEELYKYIIETYHITEYDDTTPIQRVISDDPFEDNGRYYDMDGFEYVIKGNYTTKEKFEENLKNKLAVVEIKRKSVYVTKTEDKVSFKIFILKFQQFFVCVYFQDKTLISMIFSVLRDRAPPAFSRA